MESADHHPSVCIVSWVKIVEDIRFVLLIGTLLCPCWIWLSFELHPYHGFGLQVNNTDAEGRLTLADALVYACNQGVEKVHLNVVLIIYDMF